MATPVDVQSFGYIFLLQFFVILTVEVVPRFTKKVVALFITSPNEPLPEGGMTQHPGTIPAFHLEDEHLEKMNRCDNPHKEVHLLSCFWSLTMNPARLSNLCWKSFHSSSPFTAPAFSALNICSSVSGCRDARATFNTGSTRSKTSLSGKLSRHISRYTCPRAQT